MITTSEHGEKHFIYMLGETIDTCCAEILRLVLENNGWNKSAAAKTLGVSLSTVKNWVKWYGIVADEDY